MTAANASRARTRRVRARKDKNKSKNGGGGTGKDRDNNGNQGQQAAQFQGYCSHCAKWCHKRAERRTRLSQEKAGAVAGVQQPEEEGEVVKSVNWTDAENDETEVDASSWSYRQWSGSSHLPSRVRKVVFVEKEHRIDVVGCGRQHTVSPRNTARRPDGGNTRTASKQ